MGAATGQDLLLVEELKTDRAAEITSKKYGCLFQFGEYSRCGNGIFLRLPLEGSDFRLLKRQTPVKVDPAKRRMLRQKPHSILYKYLGYGICVLLLARKITTRPNAGVLV